MIKNYRTGAVGALLDEYERSLNHLKEVVNVIPNKVLQIIVDAETSDDNCRSIQTILSHIVHSGFGYATFIHNLKGHGMTRPGKTFHKTIQAYISDLDAVLEFTEKVLSAFTDAELEQFEDAGKIHTTWGQVYDVEQMMEHAIVHILRHRRQLEKFKIKLQV
jgi:uncharacterized damage-inducible protein DinB